MGFINQQTSLGGHHLVATAWWCVLTNLKNMMEFVKGKDDIPYMKWNIKFMFQTTAQAILLGKMRIIHCNWGCPFFQTNPHEPT